jgi:hypothetical protein
MRTCIFTIDCNLQGSEWNEAEGLSMYLYLYLYCSWTHTCNVIELGTVINNSLKYIMFYHTNELIK